MQGRQAILIGQVRAHPALEELADCKKWVGVVRAGTSVPDRPALSLVGPMGEALTAAKGKMGQVGSWV